MQSGCWQWPLAGCFQGHMMVPLACGSLCADISAPASQNVRGEWGRRRLIWLLMVLAQERKLPRSKMLHNILKQASGLPAWSQ